MSKSKISPIEAVELYHKRYLEYEQAFSKEPFTDEQLQKKLKEIVESGLEFDSPDFEDAVIEAMIEKPTRRSDVNNAALKFYLYAEFYLMTNEAPLPENVKKDLDSLPIENDLKPYYSVHDGKFVRNEDTPINLQKDKLKDLYRALQEKQE